MPIQPLPQFLSKDYQNSQNLERMASSHEEYVRQLAAVRGELENLRNDYAQYQADQARQRQQDKEENTKAHKKMARRSWAQIILPLILSPLITLFIEHFDDVSAFLSAFFGKS